MPELKTVYLPHPVSPETKAKHLAAGERIVDIRFAPAGYAAPQQKAPVVEPVAEPEPIAEEEAVLEPVAQKRRGRRKANW